MGTNFKGNKEELLALNAWIKLTRANNSIWKKIKPSMVQYNLSTTQFSVLEVLLHLGSMSQKTIGEKLLRSSGNIVKVVDNLERDGLVLRKQNKKDRRANLIILTDMGHKVIKSIFQSHVKSIVESFSILNKEEQEELSHLCKKLGLGIENGDN
ncbi:MAG: MarR family transcriptional regulator [Candidatus Neomarinimicrobiota bacterium]